MAYLKTHEIIKNFEAVFGGISLPACILICDEDGLLIYSVGECADQWILENLCSYLISSFEATQKQLKATDESLDNLMITTKRKVFYIDQISKDLGLYMVIQTSPVLMHKVQPFLKNIVIAIQKNLQESDD
jgi:hypothetical protein